MLENLRLRGRILLGHAVPVALVVIASIVIFVGVREMQTRMREAGESRNVMYAVKDLKYNFVKMQRSIRGYVLIKNDESKNSYESANTAFNEIMARIEPTIKDEKGKSLFAEFKKVSELLGPETKHLEELVDGGQQQKAVEEFRKGEGIKLGREMERLALKVEEDETAEQKELEQRVKDISSMITVIVITATLLTVVLSIAIGYWFSYKISRAIMESVSALSSTSSQIASTLAQHERTAANQSTAVTETSATVEELGASSRQSAEQAGSAAALAQKATEFTKDGRQRVKEAVDGMGRLKERVGAVAAYTLKLGEQMEQVNKIANIVRDLSGQINMLALNAAVEAARAGEQGKGFSVVAGEVRKLADQSKKSAEQANTIIGEIQRSTNATIMATEEGGKSAEEVIKLAKMVDDLFTSLTSTADAVYQNAQQVMLNARRQSAAINQIVEAINTVNLGAKETAAGITQTKTGVERLNEAAGNLKAMV
ncbi:MAG: MCP four helix bundle domain-containing protein [Nitrospinae bacterium]|nr:MCP four helix bundle domain-containing protein [Nitrospinota bacterium]